MYNTGKSPSKGNKCHAARGVYKKLSIFHRPKWWWIKQMWSDYLEVYPRQGCVQSCMKNWQKGEVIVPFKSKLYFGTKIDSLLLRKVVVKTFNTALLEIHLFCCLMYFGTSYISIVIYYAIKKEWSSFRPEPSLSSRGISVLRTVSLWHKRAI